MIVKEQKPLVFDNKANAIFDPLVLERAILWNIPLGRPVSRVKRVFMHGKYPAISIHGKKHHIHRIMMQLDRKSIDGLYVDHINGNKLDARLSNLRLLEPSVHQSITNKGRKQTADHIAKRIDATTKTRYGHSIYENPELLS